jgi:hypothetical protein
VGNLHIETAAAVHRGDPLFLAREPDQRSLRRTIVGALQVEARHWPLAADAPRPAVSGYVATRHSLSFPGCAGVEVGVRAAFLRSYF